MRRAPLHRLTLLRVTSQASLLSLPCMLTLLKEIACLASKVHIHLQQLCSELLLLPSLLHRNVNKQRQPHNPKHPLPVPMTLLHVPQRPPKSEENGHIQLYMELTERPESSFLEKKT